MVSAIASEVLKPPSPPSNSSRPSFSRSTVSVSKPSALILARSAEVQITRTPADFSVGPESETIENVISRPVEPVASLGKVLGNRTTLYKYLNASAVVVLTSSLKSTPPTCGVYLVDAAKGTTLYHSVLPAAGSVCDIKAAFTENWLVYSYYDNEVGVDQAKSHRIVSVEFYEGQGIDAKTSRQV